MQAQPYINAGLLSIAIPIKRFATLVGYMDARFLSTETWTVINSRISKSVE